MGDRRGMGGGKRKWKEGERREKKTDGRRDGLEKREGLEKGEQQAKNMHQYFVGAKLRHFKRPLSAHA